MVDAATAAYDAYRDAFEGREYPLAYVDRDALAANVRTTRRRADGLPVRVASKSLRCLDALRYVLDREGFEGVMCYTGHEAAFLAESGFEDLLVAYPVWHREELTGVCDAIAETGVRIALTVDSAAHVERVASVAAERGVEVPLSIDLDCSTTHVGIHFGVRRSDVRTPAAALELASTIEAREGVRLAGVMGYEAGIAGLPDESPANNPLVNAAIRLLKRRSAPEVRDRRCRVVRALRRAGHDLAFVNGGGTGSVETTREDPSVTEVAVGSGFYAPRLFDFYRSFRYRPAAGYALEVVRRPSTDIYTCRGGGYVASGPPGEDRTPAPYLPRGASLTDAEGAGEVQTPVEHGGDLDLGDPVLFRHAKAGELATHFERLHVVADDEVVDVWPTYRGDGTCFL